MSFIRVAMTFKTQPSARLRDGKQPIEVSIKMCQGVKPTTCRLARCQPTPQEGPASIENSMASF